jgi:hypothetical protein
VTTRRSDRLGRRRLVVVEVVVYRRRGLVSGVVLGVVDSVLVLEVVGDASRWLSLVVPLDVGVDVLVVVVAACGGGGAVAVVRGCWHYARSVASASPLGSLRFGVALPSSVPLPLVLKVVAIVVVVPTVLVVGEVVVVVVECNLWLASDRQPRQYLATRVHWGQRWGCKDIASHGNALRS